MAKNELLAAALLTLGVCVACSNSSGGGGNGGGGGVKVTVSPGGQTVGVTLTQTFTASVTGTNNTAVTWSVSGTGCSGNACGSIDANGKYTAPNIPPSPATVTVTATSQADTTKSGTATVNVVNITVNVTPGPADVAVNAQQQFTAIAVPDAAPQTFTWSVICTSGNCGTVAPGTDPTVATYTAPASVPNPQDVKVRATSTVNPPNQAFADANVTVVTSRMPAGTYAFRFSGFNIILGLPIAMVGNFKIANNGTIQSGDEDDLAPGPTHRAIVSSGSSIAMASNNQGTLTLATGPTNSNAYTIVLDASGDIQMVESTSDGTNRRGSGVIEQAAPSKFNNGALIGNFVFLLAGAGDASGNRAGYVGRLTMDGQGNVTSGLLDINKKSGGTNGTPLTVSGTYNIGATGMGTLTLTSGNQTFNFNLYVVSGGTQSGNTPLALYVVSTDAIASNPAVSGTMIFQDQSPTYNNAALNKTMIASLTGVDSSAGTMANVSLSVASLDGAGHISGTFDQNNAGTITSAQAFGTGYAYSAVGCSNNCGRYTMNLLGNPTANPPAPMQFIFYATAANRGFLLDQSSFSVLTGTMEQQKGSNYAASEMPGVFAASSVASGTKDVTPTVADLLLTSPGNSQFNVTGTRWDASSSQSLTGSYTLTSSGVGTIKLTAPGSENYVIYVLDNTGQVPVVHRFLMMNVDSANKNASIISAQQ